MTEDPKCKNRGGHLRWGRWRDGAASAALALALAAPAPGQVARDFGIQGRLVTGGVPVTDPTTVALTLWDDPEQGFSVHSEVDLVVPTSDGFFATRIGDGTPLATGALGAPRWLQVEVGGELLLPRTPVGATAFALVAAEVEGTATVVRAAGTPAENGTALLSAVAGLGTTPATLVLETGEYHLGTLGLALPPGTQLVGAGRGATWIRRAGVEGLQAGALNLDGAAVRDLSLEVVGAGQDPIGITMAGGSRAEDVEVVIDDGWVGGYGISLTGAGNILEDVAITMTDPGLIGAGIRADSDTDTRIRDVAVDITDTEISSLRVLQFVNSTGGRVHGAVLRATGLSSLSLVEGTNATDLELRDVDARGTLAGSAQRALGVLLTGGSSGDLRIRSSRFRVEHSGAGGHGVGIAVEAGQVEVAGSRFEALSVSDTFGALVEGSGTTLESDACAFLAEGTGTHYGVRAESGAVAVLRGGEAAARGSTSNTGVSADGTGSAIRLQGSAAVGSNLTAEGASSGTVSVATSMMDGGTVSGSVTCFAAYDGTLGSLGLTSCPGLP